VVKLKVLAYQVFELADIAGIVTDIKKQAVACFELIV
jgi:hypothetical protein